MRLIDADALIEHCKRIVSVAWNNKVAPISWSQAYQEFISELEDAPTIEAEPVRHGEWIPVHKHIWKKDDNGKIDEWAWDYEFHNGPECEICHATPCVHCYPDWETSECSKTSYECSRCQTHVKDMAIYCPNCGAKMDGGSQ